MSSSFIVPTIILNVLTATAIGSFIFTGDRDRNQQPSVANRPHTSPTYKKRDKERRSTNPNSSSSTSPVPLLSKRLLHQIDPIDKDWNDPNSSQGVGRVEAVLHELKLEEDASVQKRLGPASKIHKPLTVPDKQQNRRSRSQTTPNPRSHHASSRGKQHSRSQTAPNPHSHQP